MSWSCSSRADRAVRWGWVSFMGVGSVLGSHTSLQLRPVTTLYTTFASGWVLTSGGCWRCGRVQSIVHKHLDEEVVNDIERREKARKRFIKAVVLVMKQNSVNFMKPPGVTLARSEKTSLHSVDEVCPLTKQNPVHTAAVFDVVAQLHATPSCPID